MEANNVSVILTTTKPLDQNNFSPVPAIEMLPQLKPIEAAELFLQKADEITGKEIFDLILE